jgi:hypothetical protein
MKRTAGGVFSVMAVMVAMLAAFPVHRAVADNETQDTEVTIHAVLDAVDCAAQTVSVLGLSIDISAATIDAPSNATPAPSPSPSPSPTVDDSSATGGADGAHGGHVIGSTPPSGCYYYCPPTPTASPAVNQNSAPGTAGCAGLVQGQPVEVKLASDQTPLAATEVKQNGDGEDIRIQAPIQAVDTNARIITVLGLTIDASGAGLDGADDGGESSQPVDLSQLIVGQVVDVRLASSTPPLAATEIEVKNFTNQADVEVDDANLNAIDDTDANGDPVDDIEVDVTAVVGVQNPAGIGLVRKQLQFHTSSNGRFSLTGLPTGLARIQLTRVHNGITQVGRRTVAVRPNTARRVRIRLRGAH